MTNKVVDMETKLRAVFAGDLEDVSVVTLCQELGISRQTFYKYQRRWREEGPAGLVERTRRPRHSPGMISAALEDEIVRLRKCLPLDSGAAVIAVHLSRGGWDTPAVSTIHRALVRRGQVVAEPDKRPHAATRRFEWAWPNEAWQIDATAWLLSGRREVWVMDLLDDHSRVALAARVCAGPTAEAAWEAFCDAVATFGLPAHVMSDNGTCFTARFHGGEAEFERDLRALGIRHIPSSPRHPQTCGKLERFHQTLKKWLRGQPLATTEAELQDQLDGFRHYYNTERPHLALGRATPMERWLASEPVGPGEALADPALATLTTVTADGKLRWGRFIVYISRRRAGQRLLVVSRGLRLSIFDNQGLVRRFDVDPERIFQPVGPSGLMGPCR
jgi:transposase InsO family protein